MKKNINYIFLIFLATIIVLVPMSSKNYFLGHDTLYHSANIEDISESISIDNLIPNYISKIVGDGYGYGTRIFYPSLSHFSTAYIYKVTSLISNDIYYSMKIFHFIVLFLSGITMYFLMIKMFNNKKIALLSSFIYMLFPYRLSEIFIRDAYGESMIFIFMPLIFLGLLYLIENNYKKFLIFFIIGYTLGIYSHLISMFYFTIFLIPFFILYAKDIFQRKKILMLLLSAITIILLVSPFIFPMLEHKIYGDYYVFAENSMGTLKSLKSSSLSLSSYFLQQPNKNFGEINFYINFIVIIMFTITIIFKRKLNLNKKENKLFCMFIITMIMAVIVMSPLMPWGKIPEIFYILQFVWRLEIILCLAVSVITPLFIKILINKKYFNIILSLLIILLFISSLCNIKSYSNEVLIFENNNNWDWGMGWQKEYLPTKARKKYESYSLVRNNDIILIKGQATIKEIKNDVPYLEFNVYNVNKNVIIEFPRYYYLGYKLTDENNKEISIYENENGFIETTIKKNGQYYLNYEGTLIQKISKLLMFTGIIIMILICTYRKKGVMYEKTKNINCSTLL